MGNSLNNNNHIHFEGDYFGITHYKLFEYLSARDVLDSISDNIDSESEHESQLITPNDFIRHYRLMAIVKSLPIFEVDLKYLETIETKRDENKRCIVCMEEYELKEIIKTLPCFHVFHLKCIDEWLLNNDCCPICKTPLGQEI